MTRPTLFLGVDTGGTFTDFVVYDGASVRTHKVLSTPAAPERAVLQGIAELALDTAGLRVAHGSTVATNAVLEGKGARTALVTNRGFADLLTIGRQARAPLWGSGEAPLWRRDDLTVGQRIEGPALVVDDASTTFVAPGWATQVDAWGSLILTRGPASAGGGGPPVPWSAKAP